MCLEQKSYGEECFLSQQCFKSNTRCLYNGTQLDDRKTAKMITDEVYGVCGCQNPKVYDEESQKCISPTQLQRSCQSHAECKATSEFAQCILDGQIKRCQCIAGFIEANNTCTINDTDTFTTTMSSDMKPLEVECDFGQKEVDSKCTEVNLEHDVPILAFFWVVMVPIVGLLIISLCMFKTKTSNFRSYRSRANAHRLVNLQTPSPTPESRRLRMPWMLPFLMPSTMLLTPPSPSRRTSNRPFRIYDPVIQRVRLETPTIITPPPPTYDEAVAMVATITNHDATPSTSRNV